MNPAMMAARNNLKKTRSIRNPNPYIRALMDENAFWSLDEERAEQFKGLWRSKLFEAPQDRPLDLEIGIGVGYYFAHRAQTRPDRCLLGLEVKFKPLFQATERVKRPDLRNARTARFDARFVKCLFEPGELNDVIIHHPDPWSKRRKQKHRLLSSEFLQDLIQLQRSGSLLELKTDSKDYFHWALANIKNSSYKLLESTEDLHASPLAESNFITLFERLFMSQGLPIYLLRAQVP